MIHSDVSFQVLFVSKIHTTSVALITFFFVLQFFMCLQATLVLVFLPTILTPNTCIFIPVRENLLPHRSTGLLWWTKSKMKTMKLTRQFWREFLASFSACLLVFSTGTAIGWSSPAIPSLQQDPKFQHLVTKASTPWIGRKINVHIQFVLR